MKVTEPKTGKDWLNMLAEVDSDAYDNAVKFLKKKRLHSKIIKDSDTLYDDLRHFLAETIRKTFNMLENNFTTYEESLKSPDNNLYWFEIGEKYSPNEIDEINHK
jgi:hypothetical protein